VNSDIEQSSTSVEPTDPAGPVDVLIVGGGLQGLVLLDALTERGYSTGMVTNGPLGHGQSLHAHGFLESGYTAPDPALRASVVAAWLPYLEAHGVDVYGEWYFVAPREPLQRLQPRWEANGYPYEAASLGDLPPEYHESDLFANRADTQVVALRDYCFPKRRLVRRLADGHEDRILSGDVTDVGVGPAGDARAVEWVDVRTRATGEVVRLAPRYVVVAAGAGTPRLVGEMAVAVGATGGDEATVRASLDRVTFDRVHMLTLRAPAGVLPDVSAIIPPKKLKIVSHRTVREGEEDLVTWYVTNKPLSRVDPEDVTDEALVSVEPEHAAAGFNALFSAVPGIRDRAGAGAVEFYVYTGCKQGVDGATNVPHCEPLGGLANASVALPSVAGAVWLTAKRTVELVAATVEPSGTEGVVPGAGNATVGHLTEDAPDVEWLGWEELVAAYPGIV
jgi:glycine/D-amino acid oxidase-like deaminating enzyme